jgi:hypothetical protein
MQKVCLICTKQAQHYICYKTTDINNGTLPSSQTTDLEDRNFMYIRPRTGIRWPVAPGMGWDGCGAVYEVVWIAKRLLSR